MAREHFGAARKEWKWAVTSLSAWVILLAGPGFVASFRVAPSYVPDFFQEWASARNYFEGLPIYTGHEVTIERYLGSPMDPDRTLVTVNAHPPFSVLLGFPLAGLDFFTALVVWNLGSLAALVWSVWLIARGFGFRFSVWSLGPTVAFFLLSHPLWEQVRQGQLNLVLLALLTGAWAAERAGRPVSAGCLLGTAAAIKLFPGFLLVYFALRGQARLVAAGLVSLAALNAASALVLGVETYRVYVRDVLPAVEFFRVGWNNASLWGFWCKLFDPLVERGLLLSRTEPLWYSPTAARVGASASAAVVTAVMARVALRARSRAECDRAFGLALTAALLVWPITWEHYFLLLLIPLARAWVDLGPSFRGRAAFALIVGLLWVNPSLVYHAFGLAGRVARPVDTLAVISYETYALLGLFVMTAVQARRASSRAAEAPGHGVG